MSDEKRQPNIRSIYFYFGALALLVYFVAPEYLLDIPTSYMLKNRLHPGGVGQGGRLCAQMGSVPAAKGRAELTINS